MKKIIAVEKFLAEYPLTEKIKKQVEKDRWEIKQILSGKDQRKILIIGPCSAWPAEAVWEYAQKLKQIEKKVSDKIKIVLRFYTQKPRTAKGWTGPIFQPNPFGQADIELGLRYVRQTTLKILEIGLPLADEILFLESGEYLNDLYSYVALGARSSEDQAHRVYASNLPMAVGVKNPTSGNLEIAKNSVLAVNSQHSFLKNCQAGFCQIDSEGNEFGHLILRGGENGPNYQKKYLIESWEKLKNLVKNPAVVIDLNHNNSGKNPQLQPQILTEILTDLENEKELKNFVKGFMAESFLQSGNQNLEQVGAENYDKNGLSITDACLGWEESEKMILDLWEKL